MPDDADDLGLPLSPHGSAYTTAKSELAPTEELGVIAMPVRAPDGATLEYTARYLDAIGAQSPEFDRRFLFIGGGQVSSAFGVFPTVDLSERTKSTPSPEAPESPRAPRLAKAGAD